MNSRYLEKNKLLNLPNSVYNFNSNGNETEKSGIKTTYWGGKACWQVITWSHKSCETKENHVDTWVH